MKRAAILFSGGPAPAANAVISATVMAYRRGGYEVVGLHHGYRGLAAYSPDTPLVEGRDYRIFADRDLWGLRHQRGIILGTARVHPGLDVRSMDDLTDSTRTVGLRRVLDGLRSLGVSVLISIGGDGTLITANLLHRVQDHLPGERIRLVHLPKTIDNDYDGIDFTFGFFTAVDTLAGELLNLRADARATERYYVAECMGRKTGWLAYGAAIAGEAHMVIAVEDVDDSLRLPGTQHLCLDRLAGRIVDLMQVRARKGKTYGTVVLSEGLTELLPPSFHETLPRDHHGNVSLAALRIGALVADRAERLHHERTGTKRRVVGVQLGYEARCASPHAFDVLLGTQLGTGAYRAVVEEGLDGHMVSVQGQLELRYVPFHALIEPDSLLTRVRYVGHGSDLHRLAHALGTRLPQPVSVDT